MGYWETSPEGVSFDQGSGMVWGDSPSDIFDMGLEAIIAQHKHDNPGVPLDEIDLRLIWWSGVNPIAELAKAVTRRVFENDMGAEPSVAEMEAGLSFVLGSPEANAERFKDAIPDQHAIVSLRALFARWGWL